MAIMVVAFSACNPLDKTYKDLGALPKPATIIPKRLLDTAFTLSNGDYALLPASSPAKTAGTFKLKDSAAVDIPLILSAKITNLLDKSKAKVTFGLTPTTIKLADSVYSHVAYTVQPADYTAASGVTKTNFKDYSDAQVLLFLTWLYPNPQPNQLAVLTYNYYLSGVTPSSGILTTDSFIYLNGAWIKIYTVSNAQYASIGHSTYNQFVAADEGSIPGYLATFLKNDVAVGAAGPKFGDVKYVSYNQYISSTKSTFQRVLPLTFDGANWTTSPLQQTLAFNYAVSTTNPNTGKWSVVADNLVTYTLVAADYAYIGNNTTAGSAAGRANIIQYPDFNVSASTDATYWSDTDIQGALITFLKHKYTAPVTNQLFAITYAQYYKGATTNVTKTFKFDGTNFVFVQ